MTEKTSWRRGAEGWKRGPWLVRRKVVPSDEGEVWELVRKDASGLSRVLKEGATARGMMDQADTSDGL